MKLIWAPSARSDLVRLHDFLAYDNPQAAEKRIRIVTASAKQLLKFPRLGTLVERHQTREVRCWALEEYEIRYEFVFKADVIHILRIYHTREDRPIN